MAILLWVDARVTLLVFLPVVAVITLSHVVRTRLQQVRARSREATARVIVLQDGRVAAAGRLEELLATCPEMQHLWAAEASPAGVFIGRCRHG